MTTPTTQREADERAQYWPHGATEVACSSCGLTMGESRLLAALKSGEMRIVHAATDQPSAGLAVSQEPKYTVRDGAIYNRASGEAIPPDEPVFIFRARDVHAREALEAYACVLTPGEHRDAVVGRVADFANFAHAHPGRMKEPDTVRPRADQPSAGQVLPPFEQDVHMVDECMRDCEPDDQRAWKRIRNVAMGDAISQMAQEALARASLTPTAPAEPIIDVAFGIKDASGPATQVIQANSVMRHADGSYTVFIDAPAPSTPTAPQAASQQVEPCAHPSWSQIEGGKDQCAVCGAIGVELRYLSVEGSATPQAATTAACQPSTLTGQPDAAICQPAATTASASLPRWIDDLKGKDPTIDSLIEYIIDRAALARAPLPTPNAPLSNAEFLAKRLGRVAKLVGTHIPEHFTHEQVAEVAGTILGDIARVLESKGGQAVDVARDAARYRVLRLHVMPGDVRLAMTQLPPKAQTPPDRIDLLCDIEISRTNTSGGSEK